MAGLFRFDGKASVGDVVELSETESHHASVRRLKLGEQITLSDGESILMTGTVAALGRRVEVKVISVDPQPRKLIDFVLVQALAKGDRDELAIQAATELGVSRIIPWQAERSISRWEGQKIEKQVNRWQAICDEASKQSLRVDFAKVEGLRNSQQLASEMRNRGGYWLVLEPSANESIVQLELPSSGDVFVIVGPEGGISPSELESFRSAGASVVRLGDGVLRTSTAGVAALSFLASRSGSWH